MVGFDAHKKIKGTKIHAAVTHDSLPITISISRGDEHEGTKLIPLMKSISIRGKRGRPRKRTKRIYADSKYNTPLNKFYLRKNEIDYHMPSTDKKRKPGRPKVFDKESYKKERSSIERFFGWIKAFRRVIIRYERLAITYLGFVHLACVMLYLRILK